jgi:hypothetical protein
LNVENFNGAEEVLFILNDQSWSSPEIEKSLMGVEVFYENYGQATLQLEVKVHRPTEAAPNTFETITGSVILGTAAADKTIRREWIDIIVSGNVMEVKFKRAANAGPLCIIAFQPHFAQGGENIADN